jgi:hypothetical protein
MLFTFLLYPAFHHKTMSISLIQRSITKQHRPLLFITSLSSLAALHQIHVLGRHIFSSQVLELPKMAPPSSKNDVHHAGPVNGQPRANISSPDMSGGDPDNAVQRTTAPDTLAHNSALDRQKGNIQESIAASAETMHSREPASQQARGISSWGTVRNAKAQEFREACREARAHLDYGVECLEDGVKR